MTHLTFTMWSTYDNKIVVIIAEATFFWGNVKPGNLLMISFNPTITQWARYYAFYISDEEMTQFQGHTVRKQWM